MGEKGLITGIVKLASSRTTSYGKATHLEILSEGKLIKVLIKEKETIKIGQRIRGFYDPDAQPVSFYSYDFLDKHGNIEYSNCI